MVKQHGTMSMTGFAAAKGEGVGLRLDLGPALGQRQGAGPAAAPARLDRRAGTGGAGNFPRPVARGNLSAVAEASRRIGRGRGPGLPRQRAGASFMPRWPPLVAGRKRRAMAAGVRPCAQATAADVLGVRGVLGPDAPRRRTPIQPCAGRHSCRPWPGLLADFAAMRARRRPAALTVRDCGASLIGSNSWWPPRPARAAAARRDAAARPRPARRLARVLAAAEGVDETRLAQELALLAVKTDVTEELDRLPPMSPPPAQACGRPAPVNWPQGVRLPDAGIHARGEYTLLQGRQSMALTRIGLDLKTVIDQMREQVQNVE